MKAHKQACCTSSVSKLILTALKGENQTHMQPRLRVTKRNTHMDQSVSGLLVRVAGQKKAAGAEESRAPHPHVTRGVVCVHKV